MLAHELAGRSARELVSLCVHESYSAIWLGVREMSTRASGSNPKIGSSFADRTCLGMICASRYAKIIQHLNLVPERLGASPRRELQAAAVNLVAKSRPPCRPVAAKAAICGNFGGGCEGKHRRHTMFGPFEGPLLYRFHWRRCIRERPGGCRQDFRYPQRAGKELGLGSCGAQS